MVKKTFIKKDIQKQIESYIKLLQKDNIPIEKVFFCMVLMQKEIFVKIAILIFVLFLKNLGKIQEKKVNIYLGNYGY